MIEAGIASIPRFGLVSVYFVREKIPNIVSLLFNDECIYMHDCTKHYNLVLKLKNYAGSTALPIGVSIELQYFLKKIPNIMSIFYVPVTSNNC